MEEKGENKTIGNKKKAKRKKNLVGPAYRWRYVRKEDHQVGILRDYAWSSSGADAVFFVDISYFCRRPLRKIDDLPLGFVDKRRTERGRLCVHHYAALPL
jgi:hypothetical protein